MISFNDISKLSGKLENVKSFFDYSTILFILALAPLIYALGGFVYYIAEDLLSVFFECNSNKSLIDGLRNLNFDFNIERISFSATESLKLKDFLFAKDENLWLVESWRHYRISNLIFSVLISGWFSLFVLLPFFEIAYLTILEKEKTYTKWDFILIMACLILFIPQFEEIRKIKIRASLRENLFISMIGIIMLTFVLSWLATCSVWFSIIMAIVFMILLFVALRAREKANIFLLLGATSNEFLIKNKDVSKKTEEKGQEG